MKLPDSCWTWTAMSVAWTAIWMFGGTLISTLTGSAQAAPARYEFNGRIESDGECMVGDYSATIDFDDETGRVTRICFGYPGYATCVDTRSRWADDLFFNLEDEPGTTGRRCRTVDTLDAPFGFLLRVCPEHDDSYDTGLPDVLAPFPMTSWLSTDAFFGAWQGAQGACSLDRVSANVFSGRKLSIVTGDHDGDEDIDLADFALFQNSFTGPIR